MQIEPLKNEDKSLELSKNMTIDQLKVLTEIHVMVEELRSNMLSNMCNEDGSVKNFFAKVALRDPETSDRIKKAYKLIVALTHLTKPFHEEFQTLSEIVRAKDVVTQLENNLLSIQTKILETLNKAEWAPSLSKLPSEHSHIIAENLRQILNNKDKKGS